MRLLFIFVLVVLEGVVHAQQWNWGADAGGGGNVDFCYGIGTDSEGNAYWVGSASGDVDFGCGTLSTGGSDILGFLAKRSPDGTCLWVRGITTTLFEAWIYGIAIDRENRIYVTGKFRGNADFGSGVVLDGYTGDDIFVARFDTAGTCHWARRAGGTSADEARGIAVSAEGYVYITGTCGGSTVTFDGINISNPSNSRQVVLAGYDSTGTVQWARLTQGTGGGKSARAISIAGNRLFVTGQLGYTAATYDGQMITPSAQGAYLYVLATDLDGDAQWARSFGNGDNEGMGISADTLGNVFVAGRLWGDLQFSDDTLTSVGNTDDIVVLKMDREGSLQWARSTGSTQRDLAWDVEADGKGNAYFAQQFTQSIDYFGTPFSALGGEDILISKLDGAGNVVWATRPSGYQRDIPLCIHRQPQGPNHLFFGGYFWGAITYGNTTIDDVLNGDAMIVAGMDTTFQVSTHSSAVCPGSCNGSAQVFVNGVGPYTYTWPDGGVGSTAQGLCAGMYSVVVASTNGLVYTTTVEVIERGDPGINVQRNADSLWVEGGVAWQWYTAVGPAWSDSASILATADGWYHAVVTDAWGCTWWSDTVQVLHVEVPELEPLGTLGVQPTPAEDVIWITYQGGHALAATLLDAGGRIVKHLMVKSGTHAHTVHGLPAGLYVLATTDGQRARILLR